MVIFAKFFFSIISFVNLKLTQWRSMLDRYEVPLPKYEKRKNANSRKKYSSRNVISANRPETLFFVQDVFKNMEKLERLRQENGL